MQQKLPKKRNQLAERRPPRAGRLMAESWREGGTFVAAPFFAQGSSAYMKLSAFLKIRQA